MLTFTEFSGSPFQVGLALGRFGAQAVHGYLITSSFWDSVMQWRGSDESLALQTLVKDRHPYIWDELQGLSKGLELPAEDVFLWNCRGDLWSMAPDGCTTVLQLTGEGPRITHNEDGDPGFAGHCAIAEFAMDQGTAFASFIYPGSLPGHSFAVTNNGLAMTVNNLRSREVTIGLPRMVLTRALLNMPDLSSAITLLQDSPRAGGFHLSLAQRGGAALLSVEFNSRAVSVEAVKTATVHANHLVHASMRDQPQLVTDSSRHRQHDAGALLADMHGMDPLRLLADQSNTACPIFRDSPKDPDAENTLASADILVAADEVRWDIYERPDGPVRFKMVDAKHI